MFGFGKDEEARPNVKGGPLMSRRGFLFGAVATAATLAAGVPTVKWADRAFFMKPYERLKHYEMADFAPLYDAKDAFEARYGDYMPYDDVYDDGSNSYFDSEYWSIYAFMDYIANGSFDGEIIGDGSIFGIFRDGWGDANLHGTPEEVRTHLKAKALRDAIDKYNKYKDDSNFLVIDPDVDSSLQRSDKIQRYVQNIVRFVPVQFLFGVHTLHVFQGDAGDMSNTNGGEINIGDVSIMDAFPTIDPLAWSYEELDDERSHAYVTPIHEFGHSLSIFFGGNWDDSHISQQPANYRSIGKEYVRREDYLHYLTVKMQAQKTVADAYFGMSWDKAQTFKEGTDPMILGGANEQFINWGTYSWEAVTMDRITIWEQNMTKAFGTEYDAIPQDRQGDVSWRFNRYVHSVGSLLVHKPELKAKIFADSDMTFAINRFFGELQHYFVGPVQRTGLGLAGNYGQDLPVAENSILTQQNMKVEAARAKAFYNLPANIVDKEDPIATCQAIRDFFNIA